MVLQRRAVCTPPPPMGCPVWQLDQRTEPSSSLGPENAAPDTGSRLLYAASSVYDCAGTPARPPQRQRPPPARAGLFLSWAAFVVAGEWRCTATVSASPLQPLEYSVQVRHLGEAHNMDRPPTRWP